MLATKKGFQRRCPHPSNLMMCSPPVARLVLSMFLAGMRLGEWLQGRRLCCCPNTSAGLTSIRVSRPLSTPCPGVPVAPVLLARFLSGFLPRAALAVIHLAMREPAQSRADDLHHQAGRSHNERVVLLRPGLALRGSKATRQYHMDSHHGSHIHCHPLGILVRLCQGWDDRGAVILLDIIPTGFPYGPYDYCHPLASLSSV